MIFALSRTFGQSFFAKKFYVDAPTESFSAWRAKIFSAAICRVIVETFAASKIRSRFSSS
jgi:hypothetical protein